MFWSPKNVTVLSDFLFWTLTVLALKLRKHLYLYSIQCLICKVYCVLILLFTLFCKYSFINIPHVNILLVNMKLYSDSTVTSMSSVFYFIYMYRIIAWIKNEKLCFLVFIYCNIVSIFQILLKFYPSQPLIQWWFRLKIWNLFNIKLTSAFNLVSMCGISVHSILLLDSISLLIQSYLALWEMMHFIIMFNVSAKSEPLPQNQMGPQMWSVQKHPVFKN